MTTKSNHLCIQLMRSLFVFILLGAIPAILSAKPSTAIISSNWLKQQIGQGKKLVILDVRPFQSYVLGHIGGAVNLPIEKTFRQDGPARKVAGVKQMQELLSNAGVDNHTEVVIYDNGEYVDAGRMFWVLEVYGHEQIRFLDGGFPAWRASGFTVSKAIETPESKRFVAQIQHQRLSTKFNTRLAMENPQHYILDIRSKAEYEGAQSQARRFGHIPSAINYPAEENFEVRDGIKALMKLDDLRSLYQKLDRDKTVITYCNGGKQSSLTYFILRQLGFNVSHYDGSWLEWGNSDFPVSGQNSGEKTKAYLRTNSIP